MITSEAVPVLLPAHHRRVATCPPPSKDFADPLTPSAVGPLADAATVAGRNGLAKKPSAEQVAKSPDRRGGDLPR
jgi:hypothetical protein